MVRSITRQVESEWDDTERGLAEGLALHDRQVHSEGCGLHPAILAEPDIYRFTYEEDHCPACASATLYGRVLGERDQKWAERYKDMPVKMTRPSDGRRISLVPVVPSDFTPQRPKEV